MNVAMRPHRWFRRAQMRVELLAQITKSILTDAGQSDLLKRKKTARPADDLPKNDGIALVKIHGDEKSECTGQSLWANDRSSFVQLSGDRQARTIRIYGAQSTPSSGATDALGRKPDNEMESALTAGKRTRPCMLSNLSGQGARFAGMS